MNLPLQISDCNDLHSICMNGTLTDLKQALYKSSISSQINQFDQNIGWTPIYRTILNGNIQMTDLLLKDGADPNVQTKTGQLPLHVAIEKKRNKIVELLLEYQADPNKKATSTGKASMHIAASNNDFRVLSLLIEYNADINAQDSQGNTPLHIATDHYSLESLKLLLNSGANTKITNSNCKSSLQIAQQQGSIQIIQQILKFCPEIQNLQTQRKSKSVPPSSTSYLSSSVNKHPPITFNEYLRNKKRKNTSDQNMIRIDNDETNNNDFQQPEIKLKKKTNLGSFLSVENNNQFGLQPEDSDFKNDKGDMLSTIKLNGINESRITTPFSDQQNMNQDQNSMMLMMIKSQQSQNSDRSKSPTISTNFGGSKQKDQIFQLHHPPPPPIIQGIQNILKSSRNNLSSAIATRVSSKEFTFKNMNHLRESKIKSQMFSGGSNIRQSVEQQGQQKCMNIFNLCNQNRLNPKPSFYQENKQLRCSDLNILNDGDKENVNLNSKNFTSLSNSQAPLIPPKSTCYRHDIEIKSSNDLQNSFLSKKCTQESILSDPLLRVSFGFQKQEQVFNQINESLQQQRESQQNEISISCMQQDKMRTQEENILPYIDPNKASQNRKNSLNQSYPVIHQNSIPPKAPLSKQNSEKKQKMHPHTARHSKRSNRSFSLNQSQAAKLNTSIHQKYRECQEFQQRVQELMSQNNRKVVDLLAGTTSSSPLVSCKNTDSKIKNNFLLGGKFINSLQSTEIKKQLQKDTQNVKECNINPSRVNQSLRIGARSNQEFLSQINRGSLSVRSTRPALVSPTACYSIVHNSQPAQVVPVQQGKLSSKQKEYQLQSEDFNSFISSTDKNSLSKASLCSNLRQQNKQFVNQSSLQTKKSHNLLSFSMRHKRTQRHKTDRANSQIGSCVKANLSSTRYASSFCQDQDQDEQQKLIQANLQELEQDSKISDILKNVEISTQIVQQEKQMQNKMMDQATNKILQELSPRLKIQEQLLPASEQKKQKTSNRCTIKSPLLLQQSSICQNSFFKGKCSKINKSCASQQVVELFQFEQSKNLDLTSPIQCLSMFNNSLCLGRDCLVQNYSFQESNFFESFIIAPHNLGPLKCKLTKTIGLMPSKSQQDISLRTIDKDQIKDQELLHIVEGAQGEGQSDYY